MTTRALVDSNILIYFTNTKDNEKYLRARAFMRSVDDDSSRFALSTQSLREFSAVSIKKSKLGTEEILEYLDGFQRAFGEILIELPLDIAPAIRLAREKKIPFWDALLASTALRHEIYTIYTENVKDFEKIPGINVVNPLA